MKFGCSFGIFLNSTNLICQSTDSSKCFRGSLLLRDNENQLYFKFFNPLYTGGLFHCYLLDKCIFVSPAKQKRNIFTALPASSLSSSAAA